jgi:cobalt-zinc-cadmium efflux system outer membrane protein
MTLVEEKTGERPAWLTAWDTAAPAWDGRSVLTREEAVTTALRNNRMLRTDLEMIGEADADLLQAGLFMNPMLNFMIMFPDGGGRSMLRANGLPTVPLQDLWMRPARLKVARDQLQQAVLRVADRAVATVADVGKVYARLQYTQRAVELVRDNMQVVEQSTQIIRVRQTAGRATQVEVNMSEVRRLKLKSELIMLEAEHRAAQRELLMVMGLAGASDGWRVEPIDERLGAPAELDEAQLLAAAAEHRLDLKAAEWEVRAAEHEIEQMQVEAFKKLGVGLGFERAAAPRSNNPTWAGRAGNAAVRGLTDRALGMESAPMPMPAFEPKMREMKWTVGPMFEMELPIFDWNQARVAKARAMYRRRIAEYENRMQELIRMVRDRLIMLRQAEEQVRFYDQAIMPEVQRNLDLARESFVAGQEDLTVYLEVQEDLLMTRLKMLEFLRDYLVSRVELERELGGRFPGAAGPSTRPASATRPG